MSSARTPHTLSGRIEDIQRQSPSLVVRRQVPRRQQPSFTERYRGTEFETPVTTVAGRPEGVARGRLFVLMAAAAAMAFCALILANA